MPIYDKSVKYLFRDMVKDLGFNTTDIIKRQQVMDWFKAKYPLIKPATISAHLIKLSINAKSRAHYNVNPNGDDDLLFQLDTQQFRLFNTSSDPEPIYIIDTDGGGNGTELVDVVEVSEFAYEKDLQHFLAKHLSKIEPGLTLYQEEDINGIEFPVGSRYIDILALDKDNNYVVVELKVSKGYDRVVGQILRYMAWIRKNQADEGQKVRGVIIARKISEDILLACSEIANIDLYEYGLSVSLTKIES